jgi:hypothetical protein
MERSEIRDGFAPGDIPRVALRFTRATHSTDFSNRPPTVIACDKREAFAQGSASDEAIHTCFAARWIASLRSQ